MHSSYSSNQLVDVRSRFRSPLCFFEPDDRPQGASAPLPLWWQGFPAAHPAVSLHDTSIQYWTTRITSDTFTGLTNGRALHRLRCHRCSSTSSAVGSCTDHVRVSRTSSDCIQPRTVLEKSYETTYEGHPLPLSIFPS